MGKKTKESKKRLNSLILLIAFTAILLIASTYAWFTTQKNVSIENLKGTVEVAEGLEISLDAKTWGQKIDLDKVNILDNAYEGDKNIYTPELIPVSTIGETTEEAEAVSDDRLAMVRAKTLEDTKLSASVLCNETLEAALFDTNAKLAAADANIAYTTENYPSYFAFDLFLRNTTRGENQDGSGKPDTLQLDKNSYVTTLLNAFTSPVTAKAGQYKGNPDSGLQNCVRVGFALYKNTSGVTDADTDVISKTVTTANKISSVSIWEPNANAHVAYIVDSNNKVKTDDDNSSLDADTTKFKADTQFFTFGLKKDTPGNVIANIYDWTKETAETHIAKQVTVQTPAPAKQTTEDANTATTIGSVYDLLTTDSDTEVKQLQIKSNQISRMRIYVWLEGQDVDCVNYASFGGGIEARIGLTKGEADSVKALATPTVITGD